MRKSVLFLSTYGLVFGICSLSSTETAPCEDNLQLHPQPTPSCSSECDQKPRPELIGASYTLGKGLGYSMGYASLDLYLSQPFSQNRFVPFLDLRGHIFDNGKYAANAGMGFRGLNSCRTYMWGINAFYDYLQTHQRPYNQVSMGLEILSATWGGFINGYLPVGRKETPLYEFSYLNISPDGFLLKGTEKFAMKGLDAEVGYRFCNIRCFNLYAGIGPYFYWGRSAATENAFRPKYEHTIGGRFSASASYRNYVRLEGDVTYDSIFKWGGQVTLAVTVPFDFTFKKNACKAAYCLQERLYQPVHRNEIIVVDRIHRFSTDPDILDPMNNP